MLIHVFDTNGIPGLSEEEAVARLKEEGYNEIPSLERRNVIAIALEVAREPMFLLLVATGTVYLLLGDVQEALMLLSFVGVFLFAREYLVLSLAVLVSLGIFIEAGFRRQLVRLASRFTILLAIVAALILLVEFFWEIVVAAVVLAGGYIIWENLRELWA